jgi:hypothetical protein
MRQRIAVLLSAALLTVPVAAGFESGEVPSMTGAQVTQAMAQAGGLFADGDRHFRILPGEGASEPIASGEVFNMYGTDGAIPGVYIGENTWSFSHEAPPMFDDAGRLILGIGMSGRIHFRVQEVIGAAPAPAEEVKEVKEEEKK